MNSRPPSLVAFDLDDTLYLERSYVESGFDAVDSYVRREWGITGFAEKARRLFEEGIRGKIFDRALVELGQDRLLTEVGGLVRIYREHDPRLALLPDAVEVIKFLRGRCKLALISDGPFPSQDNKVKTLGLRDLLDLILLTGEKGEEYAKPSPWAYQVIERKWQISGKSCAYIGDNPVKDFIGAKALGWRTIRVHRPGGLHTELKMSPEYEAEFSVKDLHEAISLLGF